MAHKTGNISTLKIGEIGYKFINGKNGRRRLTMKKIKSKGFPQYIILANEPA